jgi:hypothetical protein
MHKTDTAAGKADLLGITEYLKGVDILMYQQQN